MTNYIEKIAQRDKKERFNAITEVLRENGIPFEIQKLDFNEALGNIIVRFNDNKPNKTIVTAHYDNANGTPGANDNASACSILLNLILNCKDTDKNMEFVFFDLEEKGFVGSEYYMSQNKYNISRAINLDMCGMGDNIAYTLFNFAEEDTLKLRELANKHNAKFFTILPPGDAYVIRDYNIPTLYVVNSTTHDLKWYESFAKNSNYYNMVPDFLSTMHKQNDTIDTINIEQVEKIYSFVKEYLD